MQRSCNSMLNCLPIGKSSESHQAISGEHLKLINNQVEHQTYINNVYNG